MEFKIYPTNISITRCITFSRKKCWSELLVLQIFLVLVLFSQAKYGDEELQIQRMEKFGEKIQSHSCIHDEIIEQRKKRPGHKVFSVTQQVYDVSSDLHHKGRELLGISKSLKDRKLPIRIYLNYDAVGHSHDRDCRNVGDVVKLGEPPVSSNVGQPSCNPHNDPPINGDCWYNCTLDDITGHDKRHRLQKALEKTAEWFKRALAVERVKGNLRLSGYSACGQDGGVQLPREYVEKGVADADLVLLVTTRPTTGNTLAWAVACERDQWGRAIAGHVNVAPRHLTAEAETLLSATLIHEVIHVLGFDPHAFTHFRDERKRRRTQVTKQSVDEKLGRMVTRVVLPRVIMHSRHHYGAFSENFTGLELEDGGGRGTSGSHWEKRLLMNEIMTGSVDTRSVVSKMTLALLEDSGWYEANYSMADRLDWGHKQGTEFVTAPCNLWKGAYHCNTTQFSGCTYNREAEGYCPIVNYSGDLPQWARYFPQPNKGQIGQNKTGCTASDVHWTGTETDVNETKVVLFCPTRKSGTWTRSRSLSGVHSGLDETRQAFEFDDEDEEGIYVFCTDERSRASLCHTFLGGTKRYSFCLIDISLNPSSMQAKRGGQSSLADYCTYFVAYSDGSCVDTNSARMPDRMLGEVRGSSSRCMASSLVRNGFVRGSMAQGNGCYQHRCINMTLEVAVDGIWKACPEAGGPIQFPGFNGELICPAHHELCSVKNPLLLSKQCPNSCNSNGDCVDGKCLCFLGFNGHDCSKRSCPSNCNGSGKCLKNGICQCSDGFTGVDCSTAVCDEQCSLHGGVCDNGVCEFRCSDYAGYTCRNSSLVLENLSICKNVLMNDVGGQHCAPSESSILRQLEDVVVMPNYHRLYPTGARKILNMFIGRNCDKAAKRLACWISIQKCEKDGNNRLRVCYSACEAYNLACGASLDCSDQTLFSDQGLCTGSGDMESWF